jgi:hypothetical protein
VTVANEAEKRVLKAMAAKYKASRTPDERLADEMVEHFGDMAEVTARRLRDEFAADGWVVVGVTYKTDGHAAIELWRTDLADAARKGNDAS